MQLVERIHGGKTMTGREMYRLAEEFSGDLGNRVTLPFPAWFSEVSNIPYTTDETYTGREEDEILARPKFLLDRARFPALDCKKKAILIGAWAAGQRPRVPFRFVGVSEKPDRYIHHVLTQVFMGGEWVNADATMPHYRLGEGKTRVTAAVELLR